jgi:protein TonB
MGLHTFAQEGNSTAITSEEADVPFATIENVPVYPGCLGTDNLALKKCMSENISRVVSENFDMKLVKSLDLKPKRYRIAVQFKIDKQGNVVNVRSRADREELEAEAIRVVSLLPQMKPGKQRGKEVGVLYALPIIFEVEPSAKEERRMKRKKTRN